MADEYVYSVVGSTATPATPIDLAAAGFRERDDLQEWVLAQPEILGEGVKIISFEFDRWQTSTGDRQLNRLDVLGLDTDGRLVLAELKRDRAPDSVHLQAITYAAMASRFTEDRVVDAYVALRRRHDPLVTEETARAELVEHAGELDPEVLRAPRIVLVAGSFTAATTAAVVWLVEQGLNITLQRVQAYRLASRELAVTVSQLFPVRDAEEFMVSPMRAEAQAVRERTQKRRSGANAIRKILDEGLLEEGATLTLVPTTDVNAEVREGVRGWLAEDPQRGTATWVNDSERQLMWAIDGQRYQSGTLAQEVILRATGEKRSIAGPGWWVTEQGQTLHQVAGTGTGGAFDWSRLHALLESIPRGRWTTYGDLGAVVRTASQPLGRHLGDCMVCVNAHRVLTAEGTPSEQFEWRNSDRTDTQQEALEAEGVIFHGRRAKHDQRLSRSELTQSLSDLGSDG